jgi:hypothetical protein
VILLAYKISLAPGSVPILTAYLNDVNYHHLEIPIESTYFHFQNMGTACTFLGAEGALVSIKPIFCFIKKRFWFTF